MAEVALPSRSEAPAQLALEDTFEVLERQRRAAIVSQLRALVVTAAVLSLAAAPFVLLAWALAEGSSAAPSARTTVAAWLESRFPPLFLGALVWSTAWLYVVLRAWQRAARARAAYRADYKTLVFGAVCGVHFPGVRYDPEGGMPWRLLDDSGLFPFVSDSYRSEDRFEGRWGATAVAFSEAVAQRTVTRGFGKNRRTENETYFRGLVFHADFNKHFASRTRLVPRGEDFTRVRDEQPTVLEDPSFASAFETWTTDQVEARYVLSPSLMERLTALERRFPRLRALFADGELLLLLPSGYDRFETSLLVGARSRAQIESFVKNVRACLDVVDALALNTRIWSKE
jgi:hypothetical protein